MQSLISHRLLRTILRKHGCLTAPSSLTSNGNDKYKCVQSSWQVSLQTTLASIYRNTAQIRSCWRVNVVKTSGDLSGELRDPSRKKEVKILISHWVFCLSSGRHNWFDPAVVFPPTAAAAVAAAWVRVTGPNRPGLSMRTMSDIVSLFHSSQGRTWGLPLTDQTMESLWWRTDISFSFSGSSYNDIYH